MNAATQKKNQRDLLDTSYEQPNVTTLSAMEEARSGKLRDEQALDMSSIEAMEKSMGM